MSTTNPKVIQVAYAIRRSLQVNAGPGSSVNSHPNPFMINVIGEVDLYKAAEMAAQAASDYDAAEAARVKAEAQARESAAAAVDAH